MSNNRITKVAVGNQTYTIGSTPTASDTEIGGIKVDTSFKDNNTIQKETYLGEEAKYYNVSIDTDGNAFVSVPELLPADENKLGGIKAKKNITNIPDDNIIYNGNDAGSFHRGFYGININDNGKAYVETPGWATNDVAGFIKTDETYKDNNTIQKETYSEEDATYYNVSVDKNGHAFVAVPPKYTLPKATNNNLGGIKVHAITSDSETDVSENELNNFLDYNTKHDYPVKYYEVTINKDGKAFIAIPTNNIKIDSQIVDSYKREDNSLLEFNVIKSDSDLLTANNYNFKIYKPNSSNDIQKNYAGCICNILKPSYYYENSSDSYKTFYDYLSLGNTISIDIDAITVGSGGQNMPLYLAHDIPDIKDINNVYRKIEWIIDENMKNSYKIELLDNIGTAAIVNLNNDGTYNNNYKYCIRISSNYSKGKETITGTLSRILKN